MRRVFLLTAVLLFAACASSDTPSAATSTTQPSPTSSTQADASTTPTAPAPQREYPAFPVSALSDFPDSVQGASTALSRMQFDTGVVGVAPQILPFAFSWSFSFTNPPVPLEFSKEPSYAYLLAGTPVDGTGAATDVFLEIAVGVLSPVEAPGGPDLFARLGYQTEPTLAPINLEPDGSAPIYRLDSAFGMTLVFTDGSYYVSLTVTDGCEAAGQDRLMGGESCVAWDELQMALDSLAVIDPATLQ